MSDIFEYLHANGHLFKCAAHEFDYNIKYVMEKLIIKDWLKREQFTFCVDDKYLHKKCAICLQYIEFNNMLAICHNCCNVCINKQVMINFSHDTYHIHTLMFNYEINDYKLFRFEDRNDKFIEFGPMYSQDVKNKVLDHFVINLPKLKDRFYHVVPVILLLSLSDSASVCCVLNDDIIFYILKLIY